jgi:DNA-binding transcriptional MerR regulator
MPTDAPRGVLTPSQAARLIGVHVNTVRSWCDEYGAVLSDAAHGRPRLLTPPDVAVLQLVHQLRAEGLPRSAVLERLRQTPTADRTTPFVDADPATAAQPTETPAAPPVASLAPLDVSAVLVDIAALVDSRTTATQETVSRIDARLRRLEAQRMVWLGVAVGLLVGLALGLIAAALLLRG